METTQMTLFFFLSTFSPLLPVCNIYFWIWKYSNFIFKFIIIVKYLNFSPKATDLDNSSYFSKKKTPWGY